MIFIFSKPLKCHLVDQDDDWRFKHDEILEELRTGKLAGYCLICEISDLDPADT